jgi:hypothetical protein
MMSARLTAYLTLARVMLTLDAHDDPVAEQVRDAMDPIWYALSAEERARLDAGIGLAPAAARAPRVTQRAADASLPIERAAAGSPAVRFLTGAPTGDRPDASGRPATATEAIIAGLPFAA